MNLTTTDRSTQGLPLTWGSCRISTPVGDLYLCSTEEEAEQLRADSMTRVKPRAVFSRDELGSQMDRLEPIPKEERLDWLKTVIALKCEVAEAKVEAIQPRKRRRPTHRTDVETTREVMLL